MSKILTKEQKKNFERTAVDLLVKTCGKNWEEMFPEKQKNQEDREEKARRKKIKMEKCHLPVLARIVLEDIKTDLAERKLVNMILKKIHDKNINDVMKLLRSFLSDAEIKSYMHHFKKNQKDAPEEALNIVSQILIKKAA